MWANVCVIHHQIVNRHGPEADRHLLRCLFSHVDFSGDGKSSGKDFHQVLWLCSALEGLFCFLTDGDFVGLCSSPVSVLSCLLWLLFVKTQFLIQECVLLISKPNFISTLCYAIDNPLHYQKVRNTRERERSCCVPQRLLSVWTCSSSGVGER